MKQGDRFMKIVMLLLTAVVLAYFGYAAYGYFSEPLTTVTALEYEADVSMKVTGYVVREEEQLTSTAPITAPYVSEGKRVGAGQTLAVTYQNADARQHQEKVSDVEARIAQLSYAVSENLSLTTLDKNISALLIAHAERNAMGQLDVSDNLNNELKGLMIRSGTDSDEVGDLRDDLEVLQKELNDMTAQSGSSSQELLATAPGYFSSSADGYEAKLTPQMLETMKISEYYDLEHAAGVVSEDVYGKLITSNVWYFITVVDADQLEETEEGDTLYLSFTGSTSSAMQMRVERISDAEDNACLLVLSSRSNIQEVSLLREQIGTLTFHSYSGIRIPKEAIHVNEAGQTGVYVLEGAVARWKSVDIVYAGADNYVAKLDTGSTDNLWPEDEIILGNNLYNGKVVY